MAYSQLFFPISLLLIIGASIANGLLSSNPKNTYYTGHRADMEAILDSLCASTPFPQIKLIVASDMAIDKIIDYMEDPRLPARFTKCRAALYDHLIDLRSVIDTRVDDACSDEKISAIEKYHKKYLVAGSDDQTTGSRKSFAIGHKILTRFFVLYARQLSSFCEKSASEKLSILRRRSKIEELFDRKMVLELSNELFEGPSFKRGYSDLFLVWNTIESIPIEQSRRMPSYLSSQGNVRLNVQVKNIDGIRALRGFCRNYLNKVYEHTLMPVFRLVTLGYYPKSDGLIKLIDQEAQLAFLYKGMMVCEAFKYIRVFENDQLRTGDIVVLDKDEANELAFNPDSKISLGVYDHSTGPAPAGPPGRAVKLDYFMLERVEQPYPMIVCEDSQSCKKSIKLTKQNIETRSKVKRQILDRMIRELRNNLSSRTVFRFFVAYRNSKGECKRQDVLSLVDGLLSRKLPNENELSSNQALVEHRAGSLVRTKRGVFTMIGQAIDGTFRLILSMVLFVMRAIARLFYESLRFVDYLIQLLLRLIFAIFLK